LQEHLSQLLGIRTGETTPDGRFTWLPVSCLGVCEQAPAMMLDDTLYTQLTPEDLEAIVQRYVQEGSR
jgi:NADH-quinone oxidoreductase subunit E